MARNLARSRSRSVPDDRRIFNCAVGNPERMLRVDVNSRLVRRRRGDLDEVSFHACHRRSKPCHLSVYTRQQLSLLQFDGVDGSIVASARAREANSPFSRRENRGKGASPQSQGRLGLKAGPSQRETSRRKKRTDVLFWDEERRERGLGGRSKIDGGMGTESGGASMRPSLESGRVFVHRRAVVCRAAKGVERQ